MTQRIMTLQLAALYQRQYRSWRDEGTVVYWAAGATPIHPCGDRHAQRP